MSSVGEAFLTPFLGKDANGPSIRILEGPGPESPFTGWVSVLISFPTTHGPSEAVEKPEVKEQFWSSAEERGG